MYGYLLLFVWVLVEQLGFRCRRLRCCWPPERYLPSTTELSPGFGRGRGRYPGGRQLWFLVGRRFGHHVLRLLCKLSLEPTVCVRRTQDSFGRRRAVTLMIAKFVPGLGLLAPPVAGQNGMEFAIFLFFDGIGATLWVGAVAGRRAISSAIC